MIYIILTPLVISMGVILLLLIEGTKSHPTDEQFKEWLNNNKK